MAVTARKPILSIDVHGVLARFGDYVVGVLNERHETDYAEEDLDHYYFRDCARLGPHADEAEALCGELMDEGWVYGALAPYEGALACCEALAERYDLWAITHVTPAGVVPVVRWLYDHGFPVSCVFPVGNPAQKLSIAQETEGIVEDRAATVNGMAAHHVPAWLVDRPWNRDALVHPRVHRGSLEEITRRLLRA